MKNLYLPEGARISTPENREYISSDEGLERACSRGTVLEASTVMCDSDMRLHLDLYGKRGIIEKSEAVYDPASPYVKDIAVITRVGKPVCFKVLGKDYDRNGEYYRLSRRDAQRECYCNYIADLIPGDLIDAKVTHLESFGAFVDVGCGIPSLLSVDAISVSRISHPRDRLFCGMNIKCAVRSNDELSGRLTVSMRELLGTWAENASLFEAGQTVAGIVRSIESYGVFVELAPNLAGLAELREDLGAPIRPGDTVAVYIKSIIPEKMKIKLVIVDAGGEKSEVAPPKYFIDRSVRRLTHWKYSPENASKMIETVFE